MSYIDTLNRIGQLQAQIASLNGDPASAATGGTAAPASGASFATQLASAQQAAAAAPTSAAALAATPATAAGAAGLAGTPATAAGAAGLAGTPATAAGALGLTAATPTSGAVPGAAQLTSAQQQFAARLAADTGLDPGVVSAWLLAEESGGAASSRQSANNNDWLNIGYTDSATYGAADSIWSDPVTAADATAGWLAGRNTIPGYGTASSGVQAILRTAGQPPATQIAALQGSGWASSGYPDLPALYRQVAG